MTDKLAGTGPSIVADARHTEEQTLGNLLG